MIKIMLLYLEKLIHVHITLHEIIVSYGVVLIFSFMYFVMLAIPIISRDFSSPKEIKNYTILSLLYLAFQGFFLVIIIMNISISKYIYFYLKNLINIKLILLDNEFIIVYTSIVFFFFILTIIYILIRSYINKIISFINTKYNLQIILTLTIFGIIGIIYSFLLSNLTYTNIINLADVYLTVLYLSVLLLLLMINLNKIGLYHVPIRVVLRTKKFFNYFKKYSSAEIKIYMITLPLSSATPFQLISFNVYNYVIKAPIPWLPLVLIIFYFYIVFKILIKKLKKETFYQSLYILDKYFNIRLFIVFGILTFLAILDSLNFILLKNYTIQNILQPTMSLSTMNQDLTFQFLIIVSSVFLVCFFLPFFMYYHFIYPNLHYFHYYILAENIGYKVDKSEVRGIQITPMRPIVIFISYLALFIIFIINLLL
jgi:hypothetical protein